MNIFLAGASLWKYVIKKQGGGECDCVDISTVNILMSFYYQDDIITKAIPYLKNFLLDSGAFTFLASAKKKVKWDEYLEQYANYIINHNVKLFFELDIDTIVGYDEVIRLRKKLEKLTNRQAIPVWHKSRGIDNFVKMCQEYKYVSLGGIAIGDITKDQYKYFPYFINTAHQNKAKIHGLGFTNFEGLTKYHFDSVDSTTWTTGNRFGYLYQFNGKTMVKINRPSNCKLSNVKRVAMHNFSEWVKFAHYAEKYL